MSRLTVLLTALAFAVLLLPSAASAASCGGVSSLKPGSLGPTYVLKLSVTGTSCASGKKFVKSWFTCRKRAGGLTGRCTKRVSGFTCRETRKNLSYAPGEKHSTKSLLSFDATVTCKSGSKRINHSYSQLT